MHCIYLGCWEGSVIKWIGMNTYITFSLTIADSNHGDNFLHVIIITSRKVNMRLNDYPFINKPISIKP